MLLPRFGVMTWKDVQSRIPWGTVIVFGVGISLGTALLTTQAIQMHGGAGVSGDFPLAYMYAMQRTLRLADGPDEVHRAAVGKFELDKW